MSESAKHPGHQDAIPVRITRPNGVRPRRRIHRVFLQWLHEMQPQLATPLQVMSRTDRYIELRFPKKTAVLRVILTTWEISVAVEYAGRCWDLVACFEAVATKVPGGYACKLCDPKEATIYPSREAVWINEIFKLFGEWVNNVLSQASAIAIY